MTMLSDDLRKVEEGGNLFLIDQAADEIEKFERSEDDLMKLIGEIHKRLAMNIECSIFEQDIAPVFNECINEMKTNAASVRWHIQKAHESVQN